MYSPDAAEPALCNRTSVNFFFIAFGSDMVSEASSMAEEKHRALSHKPGSGRTATGA
jgi:hypothetical protein